MLTLWQDCGSDSHVEEESWLHGGAVLTLAWPLAQTGRVQRLTD